MDADRPPQGDRKSGPLISIVTPTFNRAPFLEYTIRSIEQQTYRNFEHIVVDGGSTDETLELLNRHREKYPLRWISEPDRGMYDAINKGLHLARGDVLAYLNSDDLYFPWTLATVVDGLTRNPDADAIFGDALTIDDETGVQRASWGWPFNLDFVRRVGFLVQPTVFWRRAVYDDIGPFDDSLRYVADCDYWMRAGSSHTFRKINEFLAVERDHKATFRAAGREELLDELRRVRSRYVTLSGAEHRRAVTRHAIRIRLLYRAYWILLSVQSMLPVRARRASWRRLLDSDTTTINIRRVAGLFVPRRGPGFGSTLIRPSRFWLEPGGTRDAPRTTPDADH